MLAAAERGKIRINELRDDLIGDLRIATTPDLAVQHIIPALSHWMSAHRGLSVHFEVGHRYIDLIEERIDIAVRMSSTAVEERLCYSYGFCRSDFGSFSQLSQSNKPNLASK